MAPPPAAERIRRALGWRDRREPVRRLLLILATAAAALFSTTVFWDVPMLFALGASLVLAALATWAPRRLAPKMPAGGEGARAPAAPELTPAALLDALPRPAFILDAAGAIRLANPSALHMFPAARPGDPFVLTFRRPEIGAALRDAQAGRERTLEFHPTGEAASHYAITLSPVRDGQVLVTFDDVSDRLAVARMRSDFVANASHELRTPLASLAAFIETLLGPARNDPEATERVLRIMLEQARRMRRLLDDLLSLSRAEMRAHQRPTEIVELAAIVSQAVDTLQPAAEEHGLVVQFAAPEKPLSVFGDRDELLQVFQNLIENALRYGASGGRVEITAEIVARQLPSASVRVRDFGAGIAPEHLPRLTERFYRIEGAAGGNKKGTGLGLAIVKHILTRHHGALFIASRPGEGACFSVELPLAPGPDRSP